MRSELRFEPSVDAIPDYVDDVMSLVDVAYDGPATRVALGEVLLNAVVHGALRVPRAKGRRDSVVVSGLITAAEAEATPAQAVVVEVNAPLAAGPTISVRDPGPGFDWVAAAMRSSHPPAPDADGGRGLYLVRMGVACVDWNESGNEVSLRLRKKDAPRKLSSLGFTTAPTLRPPGPPSPFPASRVHRILVVDDDPIARRIAQRILTSSGFAVEQVSCGPSALERFAGRAPDAVILDLEMPGMSGIDVLDRLRDRGLLSSCPVLLMTASEPTAEVRARALEAGASTFLIKPVAPRELVAQIRTVLATQERIAVLGAERDGLRESESRVASLLNALSPSRSIERPRTTIESRVLPASSVGGDVFDLIDVRSGVFGALLVDVAGNGGPAAVTAAAIRWLARDRLAATGDVAAMLSAISAQLYDDFDATHQHAAASAVFVDVHAGVVHVANAGSPPIVVVPRVGPPLLVKSNTPSLGLVRSPRVAVQTFALRDVAHVIAQSDGLVECFGKPTDSIGALQALTGVTPHVRMRCPDVERAISWATARDDASLLFMSFHEEVP